VLRQFDDLLRLPRRYDVKWRRLIDAEAEVDKIVCQRQRVTNVDVTWPTGDGNKGHMMFHSGLRLRLAVGNKIAVRKNRALLANCLVTGVGHKTLLFGVESGTIDRVAFTSKAEVALSWNPVG
jgi:hypothetical protein